jgi:type IV pilus assembly protein PilA
MLSKMRKMLKKQDGFTLIELMTVLIILGVILGIGVPKYMQVQAKAKYDADIATLQNIVKAAETYAVSKNDYSDIKLSDLATAGIIDNPVKLNNENPTLPMGTATLMDVPIEFEKDLEGNPTGRVKNWSTLEALAGNNPYDSGGA